MCTVPLMPTRPGWLIWTLYGIVGPGSQLRFRTRIRNNPDEVKAFTTILQNVCKPESPGLPAPCDPTINPRNQYDDLNVNISSTYQVRLQALSKDPDGNDCNTSSSAYCVVRAQLLDEFYLCQQYPQLLQQCDKPVVVQGKRHSQRTAKCL